MAPAQKGQKKTDPGVVLERSQKLRPEQRIRGQEAFRKLVGKGSFARGDFFYLWYGKTPLAEAKTKQVLPRLGIIVSRLFSRRAVERNALKRKVREIFRKHQGELDGESSFLIKAKEPNKKTPYEAMAKDLLALLRKTNERK